MVAGLLSLVVLGQYHEQIDPAETYGKSAAEIVRMGHDAWYAFFVGKVGESTYGMSHAEMYWGYALYQVQTPQVAKLKGTRGQAIRSLRAKMPEFRERCIDVGYALSGGGTLWHPVYSARLGESEEVVRDLMAGKWGTPPATQADVWPVFKRAKDHVTGSKSEIDETKHFTGIDGVSALQKHGDAMILWQECLKEIAALEPGERGRVFAFFRQSAYVMLPEK